MIASVSFLRAKIADDGDFLKLKEMANVHDNWNLDYDKSGIKIWSKAVKDASVKLYKVWSIFSAVNSTDLYNAILDQSYRKEWDPHLLLSFEIGHLNYNNGVSYYAASCPPPLRSRDFVLQTSWLDNGTEHFVLNHSVCHKDHPPKRGFIRAISYFTGYFIRCLPCNGCEMFFVSQTDPQGIIPAWIVNKCTQIFAPRFVRQLERAAYGYRGWKSQNNPDFFPWVNPDQIKSPQISILDCFPSEEEQQSSFFKYLTNKKERSLEFEICKSLTSFSSRTTCNSMNATLSSSSTKDHLKASKSYNQSHSEAEKLAKDKKTKDVLICSYKIGGGEVKPTELPLYG